MSDREKLPELIDRFNSGDLKGKELAAFLEMLKANPRLREEVRLDIELNEVLSDIDTIELRKKLLSLKNNRQKRRGNDLRLFLIAASLLLLIGLEVLLLMSKKQGSLQGKIPLTHKYQPGIHHSFTPNIRQKKDAGMDTLSRVQKKRDTRTEAMLAASFMKNPAFENMLGSTRNAGYFRIELPPPGSHFSSNSTISFRWMLERQNGIYLKIMDNKGMSVHESGLIIAEKYSLPPRALKNGLYYFEVLRDDEILFFGKFTIK